MALTNVGNNTLPWNVWRHIAHGPEHTYVINNNDTPLFESFNESINQLIAVFSNFPPFWEGTRKLEEKNHVKFVLFYILKTTGFVRRAISEIVHIMS